MHLKKNEKILITEYMYFASEGYFSNEESRLSEREADDKPIKIVPAPVM